MPCPEPRGEAMRRREFIMFLGLRRFGRSLRGRNSRPCRWSGLSMPRLPRTSRGNWQPFSKVWPRAVTFDGRNVTVEYRWAEGQNDRLPAMAADLVRRQVAVIAAATTPAALAAKAATTTIPIVFEVGSDPVQIGLVASLSRPGGNVTGVTQSNIEVAPKRLELLHALLPTARVMALLVDPTDPANANTTVSKVSAAAQTFGLQLHVLNASNESDLAGIFAKLSQLGAGGLVVGGGAFFTSHGEQLAALTVRHAVPIAFEYREFTAAGGLLSYGSDNTEAYRLAGILAPAGF